MVTRNTFRRYSCPKCIKAKQNGGIIRIGSEVSVTSVCCFISCPQENFPLFFPVNFDLISVFFLVIFDLIPGVYSVILDFFPVVFSEIFRFYTSCLFSAVATGGQILWRPPVGKLFSHRWSMPGHHKMCYGHRWVALGLSVRLRCCDLSSGNGKFPKREMQEMY